LLTDDDLLGEDLVGRRGSREVGDDEEWAIDPGPELLGDRRVRLVLRRPRGFR